MKKRVRNASVKRQGKMESYRNELGSPEQVIHKTIPFTPLPPTDTQTADQSLAKVTLCRSHIAKPGSIDFYLKP